MQGLDAVRETLICSLKERFSNVIDFSSASFDSKYIISTIVNPQTACEVDQQKSQLLAIVKDAVCFLIF